jgi:hypothetical protein
VECSLCIFRREEDDGGYRFLHRTGTYLPDYMVSYHRKLSDEWYIYAAVEFLLKL